jgi:hypothetical protein
LRFTQIATPHTVRAEPVEASACLGAGPFDRLRPNGLVVVVNKVNSGLG